VRRSFVLSMVLFYILHLFHHNQEYMAETVTVTAIPVGEAKPVTRWGGLVPVGGQTISQIPVSFELVLTDDLPNGPYGEISPVGGKLYVKPGSTNDDVAVALIASWTKFRGSMMNMQSLGRFGGRAGEYREQWTVVSLEYKGGKCTPEEEALAGMHTAHLSLVQCAQCSRPACPVWLEVCCMIM